MLYILKYVNGKLSFFCIPIVTILCKKNTDNPAITFYDKKRLSVPKHIAI